MAGSRRALLEESKHSDIEEQSSIPPERRIPYKTATPAELLNGEATQNTYKSWEKIMANVYKAKREYVTAIVKKSASANTQLKLWDIAYQQALCYVKYKYHIYEGYLKSKWLFNKKIKHANGMDKTAVHVDELRPLFEELENAKMLARNASAQRNEVQPLARQATAGRIETRNQPVVIAPTYQNPSPETGSQSATATPREDESSVSDESNSRSQSRTQLMRAGVRTEKNMPSVLTEALLQTAGDGEPSSRERYELAKRPVVNRVESVSYNPDDECVCCCPASFWKKKPETPKPTNYGTNDRRQVRRRR